MFNNSEEKRIAETALFEGFIRNYDNYKQNLAEATEEEKQTPFYEHSKTIVKGVDRLYPTLTDDMKKIFDMRYKQNIDDFAEVADELYITTNKAKGLRNVIIDRFAVIIGWRWAV